MKSEFPKNFLWGAATSAYQVEGGQKNNWSQWETSEERIKNLELRGEIKKHGLDNFISGRACDHYHQYKEDFRLAKELGHNATRISIEWSRIEPEEGKFNQKEIEHYRDVLKTLRQLKIEPFVTIYHWPIPLWLRDKGGLESRKFSEYFAQYAEKLAKEYKDLVKFWITINEPEVLTSSSYLQGVWPPQKKNIFLAIKVYKNLIQAHKLAYDKIKKIAPGSQIGIAKNNAYYEAANKNPVNILLKRAADHYLNFWFLDQIKNHQDFIGLNHYFHNRINWGFNKNQGIKISDYGWSLSPQAIYHVLSDLKKYHKPIYITENGLADAKDKYRAWFIEETLKNVWLAIKDDADVRGYLHWSLMDNFEWSAGFWPRFGLIEIDYKTLKRTPHPSALVYKKIIESNSIYI